jgi:7-cyano-7-deazaguanine reductase
MNALSLGKKPSAKPTKKLETFTNPCTSRDFHIHMQIPEFTCLCPKTGQPDFATLYLDYIPNKKCLELKSLKLYIWSFRDEGCFHEAVTNRILEFFVRGGVFTNVVVEHKKKGWKPEPTIDLTQFSKQSNTRS